MKNALTSDQHIKRNTCLLNEMTFFTKLPSGNELGQYLAIDLGSTNFRVILSDLKGGKAEDGFQVRYYDVPDNLRNGPSSKVSIKCHLVLNQLTTCSNCSPSLTFWLNVLAILLKKLQLLTQMLKFHLDFHFHIQLYKKQLIQLIWLLGQKVMIYLTQ